MFTSSQLQEKVNRYIATLAFSREPFDLYKPIEYALQGGGKRIRPLFLLMAYNLYHDDIEPAMSAAAAIEIYHNYTLLHDDVMDKADIRHNRPTVHKVWNENAAILSGDTMLVLAYEYLSRVPMDRFKPVFDIFSTTAIEIAEGQQYDIDFETRENVAEQEYIEMIRLKTSVLMAASLKMGAILSDAPAEDLQNIYLAGQNIGLAFQLQDDLLDVYGDVETFGKKIGGDILCNKKTYLLINAFLKADAVTRVKLDDLLYGSYLPQEKIDGVRSLYDSLQVKELCEQKIEYFFEKGMYYLDLLSVTSERKEQLLNFIKSLMNRKV